MLRRNSALWLGSLVGVLLLPTLAGCKGAGGKLTPEKRGARLYAMRCMRCHGPRGDGRGTAARVLPTNPRSFVSGEFRTAKRPGEVPSDASLHEVIKKGLPGTTMPGFAYFSEGDRNDVIAYLKTLFALRVGGPYPRAAQAPRPAPARPRTKPSTNSTPKTTPVTAPP